MKSRVSIRRRLLTALMSAILLVWVTVLVLVFRSAGHEVEEVFDADLARSARVLASLLDHEVREEQETNREAGLVLSELGKEGLSRYPRLASILGKYLDKGGKEQLELASAMNQVGHKYESKLALLARYADGTVMLRSDGTPDFPLKKNDFFDFEGEGHHWRVFGLTEPDTGFVVHVGEKIEVRQELVYYIARNTLSPALFALPLLALIIWFGVGRSMRPLAMVADEVRHRLPDALDPLPEDNTPQEVQPLVAALNGLFERVRGALENERRFTADAAHELRTPLAALKTHVQVLLLETKDDGMRQSLDQLLDGVDRTTHLVEQLLILARSDARQRQALPDQTVDLQLISAEIVSALSQAAVEKDIDLGLESDGPLSVRGDATALSILLRNLVDNAVRYTPKGGVVTVRLGRDGERIRLDVIDTGPGVPEEERNRLFDRFHRGREEQARGSNGSGLGLSIVQRIAELHGAQVRLGVGPGDRGLMASVWFPKGSPD